MAQIFTPVNRLRLLTGWDGYAIFFSWNISFNNIALVPAYQWLRDHQRRRSPSYIGIFSKDIWERVPLDGAAPLRFMSAFYDELRQNCKTRGKFCGQMDLHIKCLEHKSFRKGLIGPSESSSINECTWNIASNYENIDSVPSPPPAHHRLPLEGTLSRNENYARCKRSSPAFLWWLLLTSSYTIDKRLRSLYNVTTMMLRIFRASSSCIVVVIFSKNASKEFLFILKRSFLPLQEIILISLKPFVYGSSHSECLDYLKVQPKKVKPRNYASSSSILRLRLGRVKRFKSRDWSLGRERSVH